MKHRHLVTALAIALAVPGAASAQEWYAGGALGWLDQSESSNSGTTGAFTTGNLGDGSTLDVEAGTPYGWETEFDNGLSVQGEVGLRYMTNLRSGIEVVYSQADVNTHTGVTLGGSSIDSVDAAALAGSADPLGVTVGDLVADGQGEITSLGLFANAYYDFNTVGQLQPYLGAGIGFMDVDVEYAPSGVGIIDDGETAFAWQLKAGATWQMTEQWELYGEYAYRQTDDIEIDNDLFPGTLEIENQQNVVSIGARVRFN